MDGSLKAWSVRQENPSRVKDEALWGVLSDKSEGIDAKLPGKASKERL